MKKQHYQRNSFSKYVVPTIKSIFTNSTKSQLTIYAMIGVVILIGTILALYYINQTQNQAPNQETTIEFAPKTDEVSVFITSCLTKVSKEAIILLGQQGGYTNLSRYNIIASPKPTDGDAVIFAPAVGQSGDIYSIPYYYHMISPSGCGKGCEFELRMPNLYDDSGNPSIEGEIDWYVEEHINDCLEDFKVFTSKGYSIKKLGPHKSTTTITEETTNSMLYYPIQVTIEDNTFATENFRGEHAIKLPEIYRLALELTDLQVNNRYLERMTMNVISDYSSIDGEIPPLNDAEFKFGSMGKTWSKSNVKQKVQDALGIYIRALRVGNTLTYKEIGQNDLSHKILDKQMRIQVENPYYLDVYFDYIPMWWPLFFDMNCDDEICRADSFSNSFMVLVGTQRYQFFYTMSFPVLVKIDDKNAFGGEGYTYLFFLETNIKNNVPTSSKGSSTPDYSVGGASLVCNQNQFNSDYYSIVAIDASSEKPINGTTLMYGCGSDACTIGTIENISYRGRLPICLGGVLSGIKEGYLQISYPLSTNLAPELVGDTSKRNITNEQISVKPENIVTISLEPLRTLPFSILKLPFVKSQAGEWVPKAVEPLISGQEAVIMMERQSTVEEGKHMQALIFNGTSKENVTLAAGTYKITIVAQDKNTIKIPDDERTAVSLLGIAVSKYTIPGMEFNESAPFLLSNFEASYTIGRDIDTAKEISLIIPTLEYGSVNESDRIIEDIGDIGKLQNISKKYSSQLGFRFK